ncbi:MAG: 2,3,4,5-tetrahydropyridine-2,6-dicarboxylate N-succinyltransferase [Acidobacteriota bacterium]
MRPLRKRGSSERWRRDPPARSDDRIAQRAVGIGGRAARSARAPGSARVRRGARGGSARRARRRLDRQRLGEEGDLIAFRAGSIAPSQIGPFAFLDRDTLPTRMSGTFAPGVRIVPGGTTIRRGAFVGARVTVMPPAYVNVGAHIGEETMVDSHVLIGSCAQIGRRAHISAASQIGGVLEPVGALPVILEDEVFVGGGVGIYEGVRVGARAVLGAGVVLTGSSVLYDVPNARVIRREGETPLTVPPGAVVVPGTRTLENDFAYEHGLALQTPIIVKYRDASTDAKTTMEELLR